MEFVDKETLRLMGEKYKDETMAAAVIDIVMSDREIEDKSETPAENVLKFIQYLEGVRIRLKEIHWSTKYNFEHEQTDIASSIIMGHEDDIAEAFMGVCEYRIKPGQIVPIFPKDNDYRDILNSLSIAILDSIKKLSVCPAYLGVINRLEDLYTHINKMMYLSTQE